MKAKRSRRRRGLFVFAMLLLLIIIPLAYYQLFYKDKEIDSNIFKEDKVFTEHHAEVWAAGFSPEGNFIASGGVSSLKDLEDLIKISCSGVIVGKAIYEGRISLKELEILNNK